MLRDRGPQDLTALAVAVGRGLALDVGDQLSDELPPFLLRKMFPTR